MRGDRRAARRGGGTGVKAPTGAGAASLAPTLLRLDALLERAVAEVAAASGDTTAADAFRGLYITPGDVADILQRAPFTSHLPLRPPSHVLVDPADAPPQLATLAHDLGLTQFELDVVALACAVEVDLRHERVFAYLQDDVTMRRPTVATALDLLASSPDDRTVRRVHFSADAPLVRHGIVRLVTDPSRFEPPLLARVLKVDDQIVRLLTGGTGLDARLARVCALTQPATRLDDLFVTDSTRRALASLGRQPSRAGRSPTLYFYGPPGSGQRQAAEAVASARGVGMLAADLSRLTPPGGQFADSLALAFREARLIDACLFLDGLDALRADDRRDDLQVLLAELANGADAAPTVMLAGSQPWVPPPTRLGDPVGVIDVPLPAPPSDLRQRAWSSELASRDLSLAGPDLERVADRFVLTPGQIAEAAASAAGHLQWHRAASRRKKRRAAATVEAVFRSARAQSSHEIGKLATRIEPRHGWDDIVLPPDVLEQLREICVWVTHRETVMWKWGFGRKLSRGRGIPCLFAGPPGTGKTMAAEVIGYSVGLDVFTIDLSGVVSKWVGETEKNLDRIFSATANAILCFDEADALFGKRSEVSDAHDRYANIEISYLLQKMESHEGLTILTTNMLESLDDAFLRRLAFVVHFPFPEAGERQQLWTRAWPQETPLDADIDVAQLAEQYRLSGGNITNIALASSFLASADGSPVRMSHVAHAVKREFEKMGTALNEPVVGN